MDLLLAPHNDDEALFTAYTILRLKPLVIIVTDSYRQLKRGTGITPEQRRAETIAAMKILGAPVTFLCIPDDELTDEMLESRLSAMTDSFVYAPDLQGGNPDHDIVARVALKLWPKESILYSTYEKGNLNPSGGYAITPTEDEVKIKNLALEKYTSQLTINKHHFDAVSGKPEYYRYKK